MFDRSFVCLFATVDRFGVEKRGEEKSLETVQA